MRAIERRLADAERRLRPPFVLSPAMRQLHELVSHSTNAELDWLEATARAAIDRPDTDLVENPMVKAILAVCQARKAGAEVASLIPWRLAPAHTWQGVAAVSADTYAARLKEAQRKERADLKRERRTQRKLTRRNPSTPKGERDAVHRHRTTSPPLCEASRTEGGDLV